MPVTNRGPPSMGTLIDAAVNAMPTGPLSVYSPERWVRLQVLGYEWYADRQRSFRPGQHGSEIMAVTVPGDPAYQGVAS